jgi:Fic family protein
MQRGINMKFENKYNMTLEENIFLAKRNIVDYIYKSAKLEGLNITYPDTYAIYEQAQLQNADVHSINVVINLKHAWQELLSNINAKLDIEFVKKIHREAARGEALTWGKFRTGQIGISGTDYIPPIPDENKAQKELEHLIKIDNPIERAIKIMLWGMKSQLFWDGNKRTSMMIANKIMIENGCGIITVSPKNLKDFSLLLSDFYTTGSDEKIMQFIYDNCIDGVDFPKKEQLII